MSAITAKGREAKENASKSRPDMKKVLFKLKENQTHAVRILSVDDNVEYASTGDFNLGIYTQAISQDSPLLVANKHGGEKFKNLYKKARYCFVFASLETGELMALQVSKNQAKTIFSSLEEYEDNIADIAFNLKRTGSDTSTVYSLSPILKMKPEQQEAFDKFNGVEVELEFFESILEPKSDEFLAKLLKEAGFDTDKYLPHIKINEDSEDQKDEEADSSATAIEEDGATDEDLLGQI
ncbi:hypothetical protein ACIU4M_00680 [Bacillus altitudinis]|uniref:hypothetical protein n=1 Tax=Bacillus altitudinis TaxID=293387 RepID=UPI00389A2C3C